MIKPKIFVIGKIPGKTVEKLKEIAEVKEYSGSKLYEASDKELIKKFGKKKFDLYGKELVYSNLESVPREEIIKEAKDADIIIPHLTVKIDEDILNNTKARLIACYSAGYDNVDVKSATKNGILVTNTPGVLHETVADFTFGLLISAARRIIEADRFARDGLFNKWGSEAFLGLDIHHKNIGIIGMGDIGEQLARRAYGFAMNVVAYDPFKYNLFKENKYAPKRNVRLVENLDELLKESDFIVISCIYIKEGPNKTHHMIDKEQIKLMKKDCIIINIARGPIVNEDEIIKALKENRIRFYAADVFEGEMNKEEPNVNPKLAKLFKNTVVTPHIASATIAARGDGLKKNGFSIGGMGSRVYTNVKQVLNGQKPDFLVREQKYEEVIKIRLGKDLKK